MIEAEKQSDVCVIGGGPAGLAAAIALRGEGFSVAVFDCGVPPIDKACGEGLLPHGLAALRELGVRIPAGVGFPFRGLRFSDAHSSAVADFPNGPAVGLRRTVLHRLLAERARETGVSLRWGVKIGCVSPEGIAVNGMLLNPALTIGADGQNSMVRRTAGLDRLQRGCLWREVRRYGFRRHYAIAPWSSYAEIYWGERCQLFITPVSPSEVCIASISRDPKLRLDRALADFPEVRDRLSVALPSSPERGAVTRSRALERVCRQRLALIGDASGSLDAITGEGLSLGFHQALALARAFKAGRLAHYQRAHRRLGRQSSAIASLLLALEQPGHFQKRVLASLAKHPEVFASLLSIHVGESSFLDLRPLPLLHFGLTFLAA